MKTPPPIRKKEFQIEYFVIINDEQKGPFDLEKMKVLLEFNNINENTLVWKEGMADWDTLSKFEEFTNQITSKIVSETNINSKSDEIADQIAPKIVPEANINSKPEEITEQIRPKKEPETIINSKPEEKIILDSPSKEIKNTDSSIDNIKWVKIVSLVTLITSFLCLVGAIQQYFQFENTKEIDTSYIGRFSAWGALISVVVAIACFVYLFRKKTSYYKSVSSILLALSAIIIITVVESNYRKFWKPFWNSKYQQWDISKKKAKSIREGWRTGIITIDSLNELIQLYNVDHAQIIGNQIWKVENLNVDRFRNGELIPEARTIEEWLKAGENKQPAWCYYNNNKSLGETHGKLYNWYAVNDPRGLAPKGWHIPTKEEWKELIDYLGGGKQAAIKMKSPTFWDGNDTDHCGFNAIASGDRINMGSRTDENGQNLVLGHLEFENINNESRWWSITDVNNEENKAWDAGIGLGFGTGEDNYEEVMNCGLSNWFKNSGFSVRCLKD